jgi:phage-related protein
MKTNYLYLDNLNLIDGDYFCWVSNFFDADRDIKTNETYNNGTTFNRSKTKERKFLLNGLIKSRAAVNELRQKLFNGELKKLTVGTKDMPTVFVMCDLLNFAEDNKVPGKISCQMVAPDPFLYELEEREINLGAVSNNGLSFPLTFPISFGSITGGQGTIANIGNVISYPIITIVGTCSDLAITNETTGESMNINIGLLDTDTLIIDNRPNTRGIYLNGTKRMDLKSGIWLSCPPGDNIYIFQRNSLETKQHCTIELQSRWI